MRVPFTRNFGRQASPAITANDQPMARMRPIHIMQNGHGDATDGDHLDAMERSLADDQAEFEARREAAERACADALAKGTKEATPDLPKGRPNEAQARRAGK